MACRSAGWRCACAVGALLLAAAAAPSGASAGQLGDLREDARGSSSSSSSSSSGSSKPSRSSGDCDDDDDSIVGDIIGGVIGGLLSPCCRSSCESSSCDDTPSSSSGDRGWGGPVLDVITAPWGFPHMLAGDDLACAAWLPVGPYDTDCVKNWSAHLRGEYADDFDDLSRVGGRLVLEGQSRWGLDTEWNYWHEDLPAGNHDWLHTGDFNLVFRFAQNERIAMRSGIGLNWLDDSRDTNYGFNFTYGLDYFPCKPWIFSADIDWGTLGARGLFHGRVTAGVIIDQVEAYVGYDYYDVGEVGLSGLVAGVGVWF